MSYNTNYTNPEKKFNKGNDVMWYSNLQQKMKYGKVGEIIKNKNGKTKYHINNPKYLNNNIDVLNQSPISVNTLSKT